MKLRCLPPVAAIAGLVRMCTGRVHFNRQRVGEVLVLGNGERHRVFREVRLDPGRPVPSGSTVRLTLRFRFARFSPATNRRLSLLPIPTIIGMPGFLQKTWTHCDETGYSRGIYLFESAAQAETYRQSPVITVLKKRTAQGTFSWQLDPGQEGPVARIFNPGMERKV